MLRRVARFSGRLGPGSAARALTTGHRPQLRPFLLEQMTEWHACEITLSNSDSEPLSLAETLALADEDGLRRWGDLSLGYPTHSQGAPWLIDEIKQLYTGLKPSDVLTCVPQEGIFLAVNAILENLSSPHVVSMHPCYQSLMEVARSTGAEVDSWLASDDLRFDVDELEALLRPNTRLIVLNIPHNPTGACLSEAEVSRRSHLYHQRENKKHN